MCLHYFWMCIFQFFLLLLFIVSELILSERVSVYASDKTTNLMFLVLSCVAKRERATEKYTIYCIK